MEIISRSHKYREAAHCLVSWMDVTLCCAESGIQNSESIHGHWTMDISGLCEVQSTFRVLDHMIQGDFFHWYPPMYMDAVKSAQTYRKCV